MRSKERFLAKASHGDQELAEYLMQDAGRGVPLVIKERAGGPVEQPSILTETPGSCNAVGGDPGAPPSASMGVVQQPPSMRKEELPLDAVEKPEGDFSPLLNTPLKLTKNFYQKRFSLSPIAPIWTPVVSDVTTVDNHAQQDELPPPANAREAAARESEKMFASWSWKHPGVQTPDFLPIRSVQTPKDRRLNTAYREKVRENVKDIAEELQLAPARRGTTPVPLLDEQHEGTGPQQDGSAAEQVSHMRATSGLSLPSTMSKGQGQEGDPRGTRIIGTQRIRTTSSSAELQAAATVRRAKMRNAQREAQRRKAKIPSFPRKTDPADMQKWSPLEAERCARKPIHTAQAPPHARPSDSRAAAERAAELAKRRHRVQKHGYEKQTAETSKFQSAQEQPFEFPEGSSVQDPPFPAELEQQHLFWRAEQEVLQEVDALDQHDTRMSGGGLTRAAADTLDKTEDLLRNEFIHVDELIAEEVQEKHSAQIQQQQQDEQDQQDNNAVNAEEELEPYSEEDFILETEAAYYDENDPQLRLSGWTARPAPTNAVRQQRSAARSRLFTGPTKASRQRQAANALAEQARSTQDRRERANDLHRERIERATLQRRKQQHMMRVAAGR